MIKAEIFNQLTVFLRQQLAKMTEVARTTHEASTSDESKAEGKYDTRGLEASYLAEAQAEQCRKLAHALHVFESFAVNDVQPDSPVAPGALVETELDGTLSYYLLTPCAGGVSIDYQGCEITTLSPDSPLYKGLLGKHCGDILEPSGIMILEIS